MVARERRGSPTRAAVSCHARTGIHSCCKGSVSRLDLDHRELPIQLCPIHSSVGIAMIVVRYGILVWVVIHLGDMLTLLGVHLLDLHSLIQLRECRDQPGLDS